MTYVTPFHSDGIHSTGPQCVYTDSEFVNTSSSPSKSILIVCSFRAQRNDTHSCVKRESRGSRKFPQFCVLVDSRMRPLFDIVGQCYKYSSSGMSRSTTAWQLLHCIYCMANHQVCNRNNLRVDLAYTFTSIAIYFTIQNIPGPQNTPHI